MRCPICETPAEELDLFCARCSAPLPLTASTAAMPAAAVPPAVLWTPGQTVLGKFRVERLLGQGAMGVVYEASDVFIGRRVALKTIRFASTAGTPHGPASSEALAQLLAREARAAGQLMHPNIVVLHDAGEVDGQGYLVMEYVDGGTLASVLDQCGPLELSRAIGLARQIASALGYAHERQIVHRDVKPSNVLVGPGDSVKVADFGLARVLSDASVSRHASSVVGTPAYMAPEQISGRPVDGRADLFSLAALLYECVSGQRPFSGQSLASLMYQILQGAVRPLRLVDPYLTRAWTAFFDVALAKDPERRFQNAAAFARALDRLGQIEASRSGSLPARVLGSVPVAPLQEAALLASFETTAPTISAPADLEAAGAAQASVVLREPVLDRVAPVTVVPTRPDVPLRPAPPRRPVQYWVKALGERDREQRLTALDALAGHGAAAAPAISALVRLVRDEDLEVAALAREALAAVGEAAAAPLAELLRDRLEPVRVHAAWALGRLGAAAHRVVPHLVEALRDECWEVRRGAAEALGGLGPEARSSVRALLAALDDPVRDVREHVVHAIGAIGAAAAPSLAMRLADADARTQSRAAALLVQLGASAVPALLEVLRDPRAAQRARAVTVLGQMGPAARAAADALTAALGDPEVAVRNAATAALDAVLRMD